MKAVGMIAFAGLALLLNGCSPPGPEGVCGDGDVNIVAGEECDEGGDAVTCDADCTEPVCGDDYVNTVAGEECDDGGANSETANAACRTNCLPRQRARCLKISGLNMWKTPTAHAPRQQ